MEEIFKNWISIKEKLPESQQRVLGFYTNKYGKTRIEIVCYIPPKEVLAEDFLNEDADDCKEYDEQKDCYWVTEGWWESSWESDTNWKISENITHWMPLPKLPK